MMTTADLPVVCVVDDDAGVREALERLLRSAVYLAAAFSSATAFIESDRARHPGCLILDVRMPDLSGLDLQQALDSAGCRMPIVFITGFGDVPTAVHAIRRGAVDMLIKPVAGVADRSRRAQRASPAGGTGKPVRQAYSTGTPGLRPGGHRTSQQAGRWTPWDQRAHGKGPSCPGNAKAGRRLLRRIGSTGGTARHFPNRR